MAAVQPIRRQSYEAIYEILRTAATQRTPVKAMYNGLPRFLCPHVGGRNKDGVLCALCYQYGGQSTSGLKRKGSSDNWRCIRIDKLSEVQIVEGGWHTPEDHSRQQKCIVKVEFDSENP